MAKQKLTERVKTSSSSNSDIIHIVQNGISYYIEKGDFIGTRVDNLEANQVDGVARYDAVADLPATGVATTSYKVTADPTASNNGFYSWNGSAYVKDASLFTGEVAVGETEAVSGAKIKRYSDHNLEIESLSINKFDISKVITGYTLNLTSDSTLLPSVNANGRISGLVPVKPSTTYILYGFPNYQGKDRVLAYDNGVDVETEQATEKISTVRGSSGTGDWYNFTTTANTKYIVFSLGETLTADISNVVIAEGGDAAANKLPFEAFVPFISKVGYWENISVAQTQDNVLRKVNKSANLFNAENILEAYRLNTDGTITGGITSNSVCNYTEIEADTEYVFWDFDLQLGRNISFYDSDKVFISNQALITGGDYNGISGTNTIFAGIYQHKFTSPVNAVYIRFTLHTQSDFTVNIDTFKLFKLSNYDIVFDDNEIARYETEYKNIKSAIRVNTKQFVELSEKRVLILGDSLSANSLGYGGWCNYFHSMFMPKEWINYASGGETLTDTSSNFGSAYITGGDNSVIKAMETYLDAMGTTENEADIVMIYAGVNDYDKTSPYRYVTSTDLGTDDRDDYYEDNFFTDDSTGTLLSLSTISRSKAIGALRYIVERLGEQLPNAKFYILTPPQTTLHDFKNQRRLVHEIVWTAHRLSIPCIDVWGESATPMLSWEYPTAGNERYLLDNVHDYDTEAGDLRGRYIVNEFINKYQFLDTSFT